MNQITRKGFFSALAAATVGASAASAKGAAPQQDVITQAELARIAHLHDALEHATLAIRSRVAAGAVFEAGPIAADCDLQCEAFEPSTRIVEFNGGVSVDWANIAQA